MATNKDWGNSGKKNRGVGVGRRGRNSLLHSFPIICLLRRANDPHMDDYICKIEFLSLAGKFAYLAAANCRIWPILSMALTRQSAWHQMFWWTSCCHPEFIIPRTTTAPSALSLGTGPKSGSCHRHRHAWCEFDNVTATSATTRNFKIPVAMLSSLQLKTKLMSKQ